MSGASYHPGDTDAHQATVEIANTTPRAPASTLRDGMLDGGGVAGPPRHDYPTGNAWHGVTAALPLCRSRAGEAVLGARRRGESVWGYALSSRTGRCCS